MDLGMNGKTSLVLASSKGIGRAIAEKLSEEGSNVIISSRQESDLEKTASEIFNRTNGNVYYKVCDLTDHSSIKELVKYAIDEFGSVDVLVNNTGGPPAGLFTDLEDQDWQRAFELNLLSYIRAIREVLPHMRKSGGGRIVNIASSSIKQPIEGLILSNTFRTGILGLSKTLATELANDNVLINTIGPGRVFTDRLMETEKRVADIKEMSLEEVREKFQELIPLKRYGTTDEFAKMIVFLCSSANTYITGQSFLIDGGMVKAF